MGHKKILSSQQKEIIRILQKKFPLVERPFNEIAKKIGLEEKELIEYLIELQNKNILRQISAIFNPQFFAHTSALFAFKVLDKNLYKAIEVINSHPGVTHNYLRDHIYNLWFILVVGPGKNLLKEIQKIFELSQAEEYLYLPVIQTFKIYTVFGMENEEEIHFKNFEDLKEREDYLQFDFSERDIKLVQVLQEPLPLTERPFKILSEKLNISEKEIFRWLKEMKNKGALRRFGALFKHSKVGLKFNIMVAWKVEKEKLKKIGKELSKKDFITHCYERKSYPHWPYNLYTMCHFKSPKEVKIIEELAKQYKIKEYLMLNTVQELKKTRLKLFYDYKI